MEAQTNPTLVASSRTETGKGVARRLRAKGLIPAVCYGQTEQTLAIAINPAEFDKILSTRRRTNTVFTLAIDDQDKIETVMLRDYQIDPVRRNLLHADLVAIDPDTMVSIKVPIESTGRALGVRMGGRLRMVRSEMDVKCRPADIPESIVVDVTELGPEGVFMASQINYPEGVEPAYRGGDFAIARIVMPRRVVAKEDDAKKKKAGKK